MEASIPGTPQAAGPWRPASLIPAVLCSIPPSSPLYWVTYVKIFAATPQHVTVGHTPGHVGDVITPDGVGVHGTGWAMGFGLATGAATSGSVYRQWGSTAGDQRSAGSSWSHDSSGGGGFRGGGGRR
jgi:hypothetical protein